MLEKQVDHFELSWLSLSLMTRAIDVDDSVLLKQDSHHGVERHGRFLPVSNFSFRIHHEIC